MSKKQKTQSALSEEELSLLLKQVNATVEEDKPEDSEKQDDFYYCFGIAKHPKGGKYEVFELQFDPETGVTKFNGKVKTNKLILTQHNNASALLASVNVLTEDGIKRKKKGQ
jgi:hypothetical protein